jgi:nitrite reductase/ring-hydroxylating ferredoxin subunit
VVQYSVGFASLAYIFFHQGKSVPIEADDGMKLVPIEFSDTIGEGEMRELKVGDGEQDKVLISRYQGKLYAVGAYCSHFGAPLV